MVTTIGICCIDFIKSIKEGRIPKITQVNEYSSKRESFNISNDTSNVNAEEEITEIVETPEQDAEIDSKDEEQDNADVEYSSYIKEILKKLTS